MQHGFVRVSPVFIINGQSPEVFKPGESALYNPSFWHGKKSVRLFVRPGKDIQQVNNTISYLDKVSVESLPILSTGVCVIAGQLAEMPLVVQISKIENDFRPQNETIDIEKIWR